VNETQFRVFPITNGLSRGDLLVISKDNYKVGDVVIYNRDDVKYTIVHRIVAEKDGGYVIKGDNNPVPDPGIVREEQVIGKVNFAVPLLGYPRLMLYAVGI
jgi:signal peptidase